MQDDDAIVFVADAKKNQSFNRPHDHGATHPTSNLTN